MDAPRPEIRIYHWAVPAVLLAAFLFLLFRGQYSETECIPVADEMARKYRVDREIVLAVIKKESSFDPYAVGRKGERGLMQIMPATAARIAKDLEIEDFDPDSLFSRRVNVRFGAYWLSKMGLYAGTDRPWVFRLAEYNAGAKNVRRWRNDSKDEFSADAFIDAISFPTTKRYVRDVVKWAREYKKSGIFDEVLKNASAPREAKAVTEMP